MNKKKIVIISLCSIIGLIFLDFIIALSFNNSPIIKIRDYYDGGATVYKDKGIFTNTYKCSDGKTKTVLKTTKYVCPINDIEKDIKEAITITFDTKGGSIIDSITIGKDTELTLPKEPTRDGYVFKGWVDKNETPIYNKVLLAEDTTLYAIWEKVENKKTSPKTEKPKTNTNTNNNNNSTNTNKPNQNANNNTNTNNNENTVLPEEKPPVVEKTQAEKNDEYRKQLQNKYSVKIAYKNELGNYTINGYGSEKLNDDNKINNCLGEIGKTLKNYPNGFFKEMKDYGMPLTIYLVNSISDDVSGLTDAKDKSDIKIMIAPASLFENTLNHEIMHYIDTYIKDKGYPIDINNTMKDVNPVGFTYGDTSNDYVYYFTSVDNAYFLSTYGKKNYLEDRAVLFSDMMTRTFANRKFSDIIHIGNEEGYYGK